MWAETADFNSGLPEGWSLVGDLNRNSDRARSGSGVWTSSKSDNANYIVVEPIESLSFYARAYNKNTASYVIVYEYDGSALGTKLYEVNLRTSSTPSWASYTANLNDYKGQVAIALNYACIDDVTYTPYEAASGPAFAVKDGSTKLTSPYAYNFGLATAGTTKTFTLSNPGTEDLGVSVSETGNFGATLSATTIAAGGEVTLTVTMPEATGSSAVTITPDAEGIDPFVINVSGTIRDANKVYFDFSDGQIPDGWTSVAIGSYASSYGTAWTASTGYVSQSGSSSSYEWAFTSPKLNFTEGETILFETAKYSSSSWYTPSIKVEYSTNGSTWSTIGSAYTDDIYGTWTSRSVTIPTAEAKYIRFSGWYIHMRNIYGGELPTEPKMVVTQPTSLDYGVITEATAKTFTIANTGKATLEGISVTSSNSSIFAITGAPTSLAAGASAEVTITMAATTTGALSSDITVSATDMEDVQFTVTGVVLPEGMMVVDFESGLPEKWSNPSNYWTFNNGVATARNSSSQLLTPILKFTEGDLVAIKAQCVDDDATDYLQIYGSNDNGSSWTAYDKKIYGGTNGLALNSNGWGTIVLSDIPTTVNALKFVGYYVSIDEIAGLTYAPVLEVYKEGQGFASPAYHHFGECSTDADVTFNFTNYGGGTITITDVTLEGSDAYSTNWTESVAVPFDLVISRTYDSAREGTSEAVVTVTTTEGEFVINVDGTDKGLNAPELAVTPAEDADFGKVTEAVGKTYTVTNAGTGLLSVEIASDNEMFTVSPASLENIEAGASETFTVTFTPVAETYGTFNANITVTPSYDKEAVVAIAASAQVKDPNVWSEDFSDNAKPTGWDAGSNWTFADDVASASYAYGSTTYLTTPALTVSAESDELTFDYKATGNYVSIKIQMSKDGGEFADYQTISGLNNGDAGTYTITKLEAGDYQFRFANDDYQLDNFEGFKLNLPDHIAVITAYTIPASSSYSMTMKEGRSFEATVTVQENRGVDEDLTAKLYMGEEVIGTATGSVKANGTEVLTITATPAEAAVEGAQMHIEVEYAGGTLATAEVTRYVAAIARLTLDEESSDAVVAGTYDYLTLKREFAKGWNTVCLPFTVSDVEAFFGDGAKVYEFSSYSDEGALAFTTVETLTASYPYIVYVPAAITEDKELTDVTIASGDASAWYTRKTNSSNQAVYFRGTYAPVAAGEWEKNSEDDVIYGVTNEAQIAKAGANATIKGFRAYFDVTVGAVAGVKELSFDGITTGLDVLGNADADAEDARIFDLSGRQLKKAGRGLYIVNGKKMMVK